MKISPTIITLTICLLGHTAQSMEAILSDHQKRDQASHIAVVTITEIEQGRQYYKYATLTARNSDGEQIDRVFAQTVQVWRLHTSHYDTLKGQSPPDGIIEVHHNTSITCPSFNIRSVKEGNSYILFGYTTNGHARLYRDTNQFLSPLRDEYRVTLFEIHSGDPQPYIVQKTNMTHAAYVSWLSESTNIFFQDN